MTGASPRHGLGDRTRGRYGTCGRNSVRGRYGICGRRCVQGRSAGFVQGRYLTRCRWRVFQPRASRPFAMWRASGGGPSGPRLRAVRLARRLPRSQNTWIHFRGNGSHNYMKYKGNS